ncbi:ATP-binding protein [Spirosoma sp. BT704]|uniref:ATP-binding protein n=2 Tax=Spirosoma validum TaxID=2771355 RepID=A0A927B0A7_9BACT|nr:ATP-binding protein [Spirosoma validum]
MRYSFFEGLLRLAQFQLQTFFNQPTEYERAEDIPFPDFASEQDPLSVFITTNQLSRAEIVTLLVALVSHVKVDFFDNIIHSFFDQPTDFLPIGGTRGKQFRGFLPTGETVLFLLAGNDLAQRFQWQTLFSADHFFARKQVLHLEDALEGEPMLSGRVLLSPEYVELFTIGKITPPKFSSTFPAQRIETNLSWDDIVLNDEIRQQIRELQNWVQYHRQLETDWGMGNRLRPGYRVLFYGPPGTGKTLTASLLGKYTGRDVYKIDLSTIVSKFIGETEKNLSNLFAKAENKDWILFFDEADALFGKRTNVKDAHDKYANQEVSYLLQRIETFNGMIILASNFKSNIDDAFLRRFNSIIKFPLPDAHERLQIWTKSFPSVIQFDSTVQLPHFSSRYELTGGGIINVVQFACLTAYAEGSQLVKRQHILEGIRREYEKEGKMFVGFGND